MSETAGTQLDRIIAIVAELSRRGSDVAIGEIAERHGTTSQQITRDIGALTAASNDAGVDWLSSIAIEQEGDRIAIASRGPFRRPLRFTLMELIAIQVGLAMEADPGPALAKKIGDLLQTNGRTDARTHADRVAPVPVPVGPESEVLAKVRASLDESRALRIRYKDEERVIEPHDIVYDNGRFYVRAFCRKANDWRVFRADRINGAVLESGRFEPRTDVLFDGVFHADETDAVDVRFAPEIARWIRERYPDARDADGGGVIVTYHVADPRWLVETVLQHGGDAEIVAPAEYRALMRAAVY